MAVDFCELVVVFWGFCELVADLAEWEVVDLADEGAVPGAEVAHVWVKYEVVWRDDVLPAVEAVAPPAEGDFLSGESADEEFF